MEVRFADAAGGTRVDLAHRGFERIGPEADYNRESYGSGWDFVLGKFFAHAG